MLCGCTGTRRYGVPADSAAAVVKFTISIPRESCTNAKAKYSSSVVPPDPLVHFYHWSNAFAWKSATLFDCDVVKNSSEWRTSRGLLRCRRRTSPDLYRLLSYSALKLVSTKRSSLSSTALIFVKIVNYFPR